MFRNVSNFDKILKKFRKNPLPITISTINRTIVTPLGQYIDECFEKNKSVIFTFTPGPFKTTDTLPTSWMTTQAALGCSKQLTVFEKKFFELNAIIININKHNSHYQSGPQGLLKNKELDHLAMISDEDGSLQKALELNDMVIEVDGKQYFSRFTAVLTSNKGDKIFLLPSPVTENAANDHVKDIQNFISSPTIQNTVYHTA